MAAPKTCSYLERVKKVASSIAKLYDTIVIIKFEGTEKQFSVHKGLICHYAEYFRGAFQGSFSEGKVGEVTLPVKELPQFEAFFQMLYTGKLFGNSLFSELQKGQKRGKAVKLYIWAEMRGSPVMKNAAIDSLLDCYSTDFVVPTSCIIYTYANTTKEKDPMRMRLVDMMVFANTCPETFFSASKRGVYPNDFLFDICESSVGIENKKRPTLSAQEWGIRDRCIYHDHTDINASKTAQPAIAVATSPQSAPEEGSKA